MDPRTVSPMQRLYLASASPRRTALLSQIGVAHDCLVAEVDESVHPGESPETFVLRVALDKARAGRCKLGAAAGTGVSVLGADTAVVIDGEILGKPRDEGHALAMLGQLSGRTHRVLSGVALVDGERERTRLSESRVSFRLITPGEAWAYWHSGEPADKAGGYAIQGLGAVFVARLEGSYSGVMGLPLYETAMLLQEAGFGVFPGSGTVPVP